MMVPVLAPALLLAAIAHAGSFTVRAGLRGDSGVGADTVTAIGWSDRLGHPRSVQLVTKSVKYNPGWLAQYVYDDPPVTVNAVDSGSGGLTDVSHGGGLLKSKGRGEWSSRGHRITWRFRGAHHGIVRVEYVMPFVEDDKTKKVGAEPIRVVRDLFFASGTDHLVYAITLDFSRVPKNKAGVDTRSPYLRWDMDGSGGGMGPYTGFRCGTDGTLRCDNTATATGRIVKTLDDNTVPYAYLWNAGSGRCEAIIGTRPYAELPQGSECWAGSTTAILSGGSWARDEVEAWKLPYQVGAYSGWIEKLSWQVPYQLGHESVAVGRYSYAAWPRYSYATLVLLDRMERGSFERLLAEQERTPLVKATAATGTVAADAPAGPGRDTERVPLRTAGYDPLLRAWRFGCAGTHADVTIDPGAGTLDHPVVLFENYTGRKPPVIPNALVSWDRDRHLVYATVTSAAAGPIRIVF